MRINRKTKEERMREKHPALKELWEKYQTMYRLLDDNTIPNDKSIDELAIDLHLQWTDTVLNDLRITTKERK